MIRKDAGLYCGPRLRKGEVFAYVGLPQNLKDLKDLKAELQPPTIPGQKTEKSLNVAVPGTDGSGHAPSK